MFCALVGDPHHPPQMLATRHDSQPLSLITALQNPNNQSETISVFN
jgi:hypothetical protein